MRQVINIQLAIQLVGALIIVFLLSACGRGELPPIGGGEGEIESNTVYRISCRRDYLTTTFKYVAIIFPNGDSDTYCSVDWLGENTQMNSSGHRYAISSGCILEQTVTEYWRFTLNNQSSATVEWTGLEQAVDRHANVLPYTVHFQSCNVETWEDENWYSSYYPFNEHLL